MRLRLKSSVGTFNVSELQETNCFQELIDKISELTGLSKDSLKVKIGYPPKQIYAKPSDTLTVSGIQNGDQIIVEGGESSPSTPSSSSVSLPKKTDSNPKSEITTRNETNLSSSGSSNSPGAKESTSGLPKIVSGQGKDAVQVNDGYMIVREMKDDNSCLFRSISYLYFKDVEFYSSLREIIVQNIKGDQLEYNEAILGQDPDEYINWMLTPKAWGGAIELSIFSKHFQTEIVSIDVQTLRMDRFGEGQYAQRMFVLYSGIHYDAIVHTPYLKANESLDTTLFDTKNVRNDDDHVFKAAKMLGSIWQKKRKYTDLANFTLKCSICSRGLKGQKEAQDHATVTGHTFFTEYS